MANILTEGEQRDAARIAARRAREADRVQRFLHDPFNRQVGQDYQGLREQIAEKEERDAFLKNQEQEEIEQQRRLADRMQAVELQREDEERRRKEQVVMANKALAQDKAAEREREARKDQQMKERAEVSGLKLVGEDPYAGERKKMQALQMQRWCDQQTTLKNFEAEKAAKAEAKYLQDLAAQEDLRSRVEAERLAEQKRLQDQVREANRLAGQQKRESDSRERARTLQAAGSLVTTEDMLSAGAQRGNDFKGLTPEQKERIKADNARLVAEADARKRREKEEAEAEGRMRRDQALYAQRQALLDQEEKRREREAHLAALQMQAQERKAQEEADKRRQGPDDMRGFFDGFGRSSR
jgi:hypothetical protein